MCESDKMGPVLTIVAAESWAHGPYYSSLPTFVSYIIQKDEIT